MDYEKTLIKMVSDFTQKEQDFKKLKEYYKKELDNLRNDK